MASLCPSFFLLFITADTADGYLNYAVDRCVFYPTELQDVEYINSYYYNKVEFLRFNSSVGTFVGLTEFGMKQAKYWNNDPAELSRRRAQKETYCQNNVGIERRSALSKSVTPTARVHSTTPSGGKHPAMLVCSVYDFYPKMISVKWTRDGQVLPLIILFVCVDFIISDD